MFGFTLCGTVPFSAMNLEACNWDNKNGYLHDINIEVNTPKKIVATVHNAQKI